MVACLTIGPVGLGDGAAGSDGSIGPNTGTGASVILPTCDANGTVLKPSRPVRSPQPITASIGHVECGHVERGVMHGRRLASTQCSAGIGTHRWRRARRHLGRLATARHHHHHPHYQPSDHRIQQSGGRSGGDIAAASAATPYQLVAAELYPPLPAAATAEVGFFIHKYGTPCINGSGAVSSGCVSRWDAASPLPLVSGGPSSLASGGRNSTFYPWELLTVHQCSLSSWCVLGELSK